MQSIFSSHSAIKLEINKNEMWKIVEIKWHTFKQSMDQRERNEIENKIYQNLWDTVKVALRGEFIAVSAYIKK